jgi:hypothetical protein
MRLLKKDEYVLFERLVSLSQAGMHKTMAAYLKSKYKKVISTDKYIVAIGDIPIALVAHMDTVFKYPVDNMYYDQQKGVLWSPEGLGADDRAGIFAIIQIIKSGLRPSVILTTDEETGAKGAYSLASEPCPIPDLKYMIQLDRRGTNDCVFYDCYNPTFINYVEQFGFVERWGTFSDISVLMPAWKICGVNLSVGYEDEHSVSEVLFIKPLFDTIAKVRTMLTQTDIPTFEYKDIKNNQYYYSWVTKDHPTEDECYGVHCGGCGELFMEYETYPVKTATGTIKFYCPNCIIDKVHWCTTCNEAYEKGASEFVNMCPDCVKKASANEK